MVVADGLAIGVGTWLHKRLLAQLVHVLASLLFHVFGLWILFGSALGWRSAAITVATAVALAAAIASVIHRSQTSHRRRTRAAIAGRSPDVV
jgi:Ca2+/H+ antiporter, TMEM165/GDT1 family